MLSLAVAARALGLAVVLGCLHSGTDFFKLPARVDHPPHTGCLTGASEINALLRPEHKFQGQVSSVGAS